MNKLFRWKRAKPLKTQPESKSEPSKADQLIVLFSEWGEVFQHGELTGQYTQDSLFKLHYTRSVTVIADNKTILQTECNYNYSYGECEYITTQARTPILNEEYREQLQVFLTELRKAVEWKRVEAARQARQTKLDDIEAINRF